MQEVQNRGANVVTLLLVEDDDIDAMSIQRSFEKERIANPILRACDGQEALELLQHGLVPSPFIILLDLQMPRMNGLEFLQLIRQDPEFGSAVVFVLTTSTAEQDIAASYRRHIAGYFVKDEAANGFRDVIKLLDGYWQIAELPMIRTPR
ncbi:two-component system response regulator [Pokkaliibacter plantistimulans]|uniref:Two-component system response regulator n=1 Tax=Proteobacteria bacterium 228 TaxID=2083153 RepID=A0A2S5KT22_9PROT|nr:response regulator [Pokkaliibacter plantistimulans]PPC77863.1 two-component system response regulator [Pokkaliibacter plantistimulans]